MKTGVLAALILYVAATLQFALPAQLEVLGGRPDFLLVVVFVLAPWMNRGGSTLIGFIAGAWTGAIVGANLAHYCLSRTLGGFAAGWSRSLRFETGPVLMGLLVAIGTFGTYLVFMFTAAPKALGPYLLDTIVGAVYNGVLAMPLYALVRWILGDPNRRGS